MLAAVAVLGLQQLTRLNVAVTHNHLAAVQAHWLARAGIERAMAELSDDVSSVDATSDSWYHDPTVFEEVALAPGHSYSVVAPVDPDDDLPPPVRFGLVDLAGRVNVNVAGEAQLSRLPLLGPRGIAALLDWRDGDDQPEPGGAERDYYERLRFGYESRNRALATRRELLLVRDIGEPVFFGEDLNLNGALDANENDGSRSPPDDNGDGLLQAGLASLTTVHSYEPNRGTDGRERINISRADKDKLASELHFTSELADKVVEHRNSSGNRFRSPFDLLQVPAPSGSSAAGGAGRDSDGQKKVSRITLTWLATHWDRLTVSDDRWQVGRINVNTAPRIVLRSLPGLDDAAVDAIATHRHSARGPLGSVGELYTAGTLNETQFKAVAALLSVRSNVFQITGRGRAPGGITRAITAIVDRNPDRPRIVYWHQTG